MEYNGLKLSVDYYTAATGDDKVSTLPSGNLTVTERVWQATHNGKWVDVSVPEERRRR
jgi:predicted glutamine amidotransferase